MWTIAGRKVFETLDELVAPEHSSLVIVDVQNDYVSPGGYFDRIGLDISMMPAVVETNSRLIEAAHLSGVLVVYIQSLRLPQGRGESPARLRFFVQQQGFPLDDLIIAGSWGADIPDAICPGESDVVVPKYTHNAFVGTVLDKLLRSNGVKTVVVTGTSTNGCVEATAKGAYYHDYYVVAVSDACGQPLADGPTAPAVFQQVPSATRICPDVYDSDSVIQSWREVRSDDDTR